MKTNKILIGHVKDDYERTKATLDSKSLDISVISLGRDDNGLFFKFFEGEEEREK